MLALSKRSARRNFAMRAVFSWFQKGYIGGMGVIEINARCVNKSFNVYLRAVVPKGCNKFKRKVKRLDVGYICKV